MWVGPRVTAWAGVGLATATTAAATTVDGTYCCSGSEASYRAALS